MKRIQAIVSAGMFVAWATAGHAQTTLQTRDVGYGVRVGLPSGWSLSSSKELAEIRAASVARMRAANDPRAQELASQSENNPPIFAATTQAIAGARIGMTGTKGADFTPAMFRAASIELLTALKLEACDGFDRQARDRGGKSECGIPEVLTVAGRSAVVIAQSATIPSIGMDNRRLNVLIPSRGMMFSMYLSFPRQQYDDALVRRILATVAVPE
jgi:hypothetical protein